MSAYAYYPGCSLTASAVEYDQSTRKLLEALDVEVTEIPGWTCCGASAVESVSELLSLSLPARNLALAEKELPGMEVMAPCSACWLNLYKARHEVLHDRTKRDAVSRVLAEEDLVYAGAAPVRHLLDVLVNDIGPDKVKAACTRELAGLTVAPYYGCQALRPYRVFDDPNRPTSMGGLIQAVGAKVFDWEVGARCCGASLMVTHPEAALEATGLILDAAQHDEKGGENGGADVIVTVCPLCQLNLEAYQDKALKTQGGGKSVAILYLPQLLGLGLGLTESEVMLHKNLAVTGRFRDRLRYRPETDVEETADPPTEEMQKGST